MRPCTGCAQAQVDFETPPWPKISKEAKDCVQRLLLVKAEARPSAGELLQVGCPTCVVPCSTRMPMLWTVNVARLGRDDGSMQSCLKTGKWKVVPIGASGGGRQGYAVSRHKDEQWALLPCVRAAPSGCGSRVWLVASPCAARSPCRDTGSHGRCPGRLRCAGAAFCCAQHPWLRQQGVAMERPLDSVVLSRMKKFSAMNKLRKAALLVIAKSLSADEINGAHGGLLMAGSPRHLHDSVPRPAERYARVPCGGS